MSYTSSLAEREKSDAGAEIARTFVAIALLAGLFALLAFAPRRDPAKTIAGIPCSVVSENEVAFVLGTPVRLLPTTGTICRYVSTNSRVPRSVYVVAHHADDPLPANGNRRVGQSLFVRHGAHAYVFTVIAPDADDATVAAGEEALALAVARTVVAKTR